MSSQTQPHIPTDCSAVGELLSAYLDGELTADEQQAVEAHLKDCPDCANLAEALRSLREEIGGTQLTPPPALHGNIMAHIRRENRLRRIRRFTAVGAAGVAAMFCVVIMGNAILGSVTADEAAPMYDAENKSLYSLDASRGLPSDVSVMDTTVEADMHMAATAAPEAEAYTAGTAAAVTTAWVEATDAPVCTAAPGTASSSRIIAAVLPQAMCSIPLAEALDQSTALDRIPSKADNVSAPAADALAPADTLQGMMQNPRATLAEQQLGTLCTVELTDGDTVRPYVYSLTDGRRLTLADFAGDVLAELSATFPIGPDTPFCPSAEGLILDLSDSERVTLVWIAFPALAERAGHFGMNETPILAPEGARLVP